MGLRVYALACLKHTCEGYAIYRHLTSRYLKKKKTDRPARRFSLRENKSLPRSTADRLVGAKPARCGRACWPCCTQRGPMGVDLRRTPLGARWPQRRGQQHRYQSGTLVLQQHRHDCRKLDLNEMNWRRRRKLDLHEPNWGRRRMLDLRELNWGRPRMLDLHEPNWRRRRLLELHEPNEHRRRRHHRKLLP